MKFGLHSVNLHTCGHPDAAARLARAAEDAGFESLWVADHVVLPDPPVPGRPMAPDMRLLDPLIALTYFAAHTSRVKLATGVVILPQRQALVIAKQLASLDVLSNGRVIFGIGVGWCEPEMRSVGAPFAERGHVADDYLAAMRAVWTQPKPSYKGPYVAFDGVQAMPRPVQIPIPIVVGGRTPPGPRPPPATPAWPRAAPPVHPAHGISIHGDLKYGPGFSHFAYVDPRAPKGGSVTLRAIGTFDNLNPFILKGVPAAGIGNTFDTLMVPSSDEPASEYGLVAETIETPADRAWVVFTLRAAARFHDGSPMTVEDVIWTFDTLRTRGHPLYRSYYAQVASVESIGPRTVKFTFKGSENRELPVILGQLPVLSKAYWAGRDFAKTTLEPPLGSGPYRIESLEPGRAITYRRVADYWGAALPVNVGRFNFDTIRYDYYRDDTVALEAFKG